jgi:hypothetical protein
MTTTRTVTLVNLTGEQQARTLAQALEIERNELLDLRDEEGDVEFRARLTMSARIVRSILKQLATGTTLRLTDEEYHELTAILQHRGRDSRSAVLDTVLTGLGNN